MIFDIRVDLFIPGVDTVGGFSVTSSPQELDMQSTLKLAVKYSTHPPALWIHNSVSITTNLKPILNSLWQKKFQSTTM